MKHAKGALTQTSAKVEIICVGNELLIGKILNTNAQWLSKQITTSGASVKRVTVIPDDVDEIAATIREALQRKPNFIITTGGLGPTFDDKTLEGIAKGINRKPTVNPEALRMVKEKYETYARQNKTKTVEMTQPRIKMATIPEETKPVANPVGTAPAVIAQLEGTILIALPGVPKEMEAIYETSIVPLLRKTTRNILFYERSIYVNNVMESTLAPLIDKAMKDNEGIYIKSHPKGKETNPHMEIHFSTTTADNEVDKKLDNAVRQLSELIRENGGEVLSEKQVNT